MPHCAFPISKVVGTWPAAQLSTSKSTSKNPGSTNIQWRQMGRKKTRKPIGMRVSRGFEAAWDRQMVPIVGFELTTYRLQGGCSTPELNRRAIRF
jgi:hypothetical protein